MVAPARVRSDRPAEGVRRRNHINLRDRAMSEEGQTPSEAEGTQPQVAIVAQYIKDLSFENPGAPALMNQGPQIDLGVDLQARRGDAEHFEVELKLRVTAKTADNKTAFLLELAYAGLFRIVGVPDEMLQPL